MSLDPYKMSSLKDKLRALDEQTKKGANKKVEKVGSKKKTK